MRRFSAHYIFIGTGDVLKKGIITVNDEGIITELIDTGGDLKEEASVEFYNGILVPGFINSHCHLELSHLRNVFPEKLKMAAFLKSIWQLRAAEESAIVEAARKADQEMWRNGITAVGDISNNNLTFGIKSSSKLYYHTFIECLGFAPERAERAFEWSETFLAEAKNAGLKASVVPHAPYSISKPLFDKISALAVEENSILSMHSQESLHEDELYREGNGPIYEHLKQTLLVDLSFFTPSGKSAIATVLNWLPADNQLLLVHNTCTGTKDIEMIQQERSLKNTWFVLCPNSNLYIEDRLPDINLFREQQLNICIGTDSLSSNNQLSVLEEIKTISKNFPRIPLDELISWATYNGAKALKIDDWAGTIEKGKKPGINLIEGMDLQNLQLKSDSKVRRLI
jgi:cytosine/adenosine deaminase-related metal-dependent hydrolase